MPKSHGESLPDKFSMSFEPTTIEHLGLKLYHFLPPVIGELVSNAWDADSKKVEIALPSGKITDKSEVVVRDYGRGMDAKSLQEEYLAIGRNCREAYGKDESPGGRKLMGRKGIGKLSAFGIATELELLTVRDGYAICVCLDYAQMRQWPKGKPYEPKIVHDKCGKTKAENGTEIRLRKLHRTSAIDEDHIRKGLARRFLVIDDNFAVIINGKEVSDKDRRLKDDCKNTWDVSELPGAGVVDSSQDWKVSGWIGLVEKSSQTDRGVDVFARGKAVELETMFGLKTTHIQFARAYVVGEVHADFLDEGEDNVTTGRNAVHWESAAGQKLEEWGQKALGFVFDEWLKLQKKEKEEKLVKTDDFDKWLETRTKREQAIAKKLVQAIVNDQDIEPESAKPLLNIIKTNVEYEAFRDLVDEMEENKLDAVTFLKLFEDWQIIEAREHLKLSDGRLEVMEKLSNYIDKGALEVQQIQPLFEKEGWLINPTWTSVSGQTTYTKLLRENCAEGKDILDKDRRIDILGYSVGGGLHIIELKRPEKTLGRKDLEQVESYVDWARTNILGTGEDSPKYIQGTLIVGNLSSDGAIREKMKRLAGTDIRVETYRDLLERARKVYGQVEKRLQEMAPEYTRAKRHERKKVEKKKP